MDLNQNTTVVDEQVAETEPSETVSEEMTEVAEPSEEVNSSEETQEVAEPVKSEADKAFAKMRRENEALAKEKEKLQEALGLYFEGENSDDLYIKAQANYQQRSPEEVKAEIEAQRESESILEENKTLKQTLTEIKTKQLISDGLKEIQAIDSNVKDLSELGEDFINYIGKGLSTKEAYYAVQAKKLAEEPTKPKPIGDVNVGNVERTTFDETEIDNMTFDEVKKNLEKVKASLRKK